MSRVGGRPPRTVLLLALLLPLWVGPAATALAGPIYKWTDDQGQTHYGESVPEKYQKSAKLLSPVTVNPTPEQQADAQAQAARDKARAATAGAAALPAPSPLAGSAVRAASAPASKRPLHLPDATTDCATWARLYQESLDCFGPFRTTRGATKPEAFERCNVVDEPPTRCLTQLPR